MRLLIVRKFWGLNTDRILQPFFRKVVLSQNVSPQGVYRMHGCN